MSGARSTLRKVRRAGGFAVLAVTSILLFTGTSAAIGCSLFPPGVILTLTVTYTPGPPPVWTVTADPCATSGFQLDLQFNSTMTFMSGGDLSPFTGPPPTLVGPGDLQFSGSGGPVAGNAYIFDAVFQGTNQAEGSIFTVLGAGSDFVTIVDTSTGHMIVVGPPNITPASASAPEPSSLALLSTAMLGMAGVVRKRMTRR